jgi:predicted ATP-dependent Lon-type protease
MNNESPMAQARKAELARRGLIELEKKLKEAKVEQESQKQVVQEPQEQTKPKSKKKTEPEVEIVEVQEEVVVNEEKEVFPPVLENKAIDSFEIKEETVKDEEIL